MAEKIYNKLVRDKIPKVIKDANKKPYIHTATSEEVKSLLLNKLIEELEEFKATPNEEELADILEVVDGIIDAFELDKDKILKTKVEKLYERGGFKKRIVLEKVTE